MSKINSLLTEVYAKIQDAELVADETGETFRFSLGYGMGGTYYPKKPLKMSKADALKLLRTEKNLSEEQRNEIAEAIDGENENDYYNGRSGWVSSSQQC